MFLFLISLFLPCSRLSFANILASYDFATPGQVVKETSGNGYVGDLVLQGDYVWLDDRVGVRIGIDGFANSSMNIASLIPRLNTTSGLSVEVWYTANYSAPTLLGAQLGAGPAIFGLSTNYSQSTTYVPCTCPPQNPTSFYEVRFRGNTTTNANLWSPKLPATTGNCSCTSTNPAPANFGMIQLILTTKTVWINGVDALDPVSFNPTKFNIASLDPLCNFYLAPINIPGVLSFAGDFFKVVIHDKTLSQTEVADSYAAWIANSPPHTSDKMLTVPEGSTISFSLTAFDFDDNTRSENVTCYVATLPSPGWLDFNGVNLTQGSLPFASARDNPIQFTFHTLEYGHGYPYAMFDFYCADPWSDSNNSTISFNVTHVNHPPEQFDDFFSIVRLTKTRFQLNGTDVDGDRIASVRVSSLPLNGSLYNPSSGDVFNSTNLDIVLTQVTEGIGWDLDYVSDSTSGISGGVFVMNDTFTYSVEDEFGLWSDFNSTVTITVTNNLVAGADASGAPAQISANQASTTSALVQITLPGTDSTGQKFDAIITTFPNVGQFYSDSAGTQVMSASNNKAVVCDPSLPSGPKVCVYYQGPPFTLTGANFSYILVTQGSGWASAPVMGTITINPQLFPPVVTINPDSLSIAIVSNTDGLLDFTIFDWNNATYQNTGNGYHVTIMPSDGFDPTKLGSVRPYISCGSPCIDYLIPPDCTHPPCAGLGDPAKTSILEFYADKANFSQLTQACHHIGLQGNSPGSGNLDVKVRNGINNIDDFSNGYEVKKTIAFNFIVKKAEEAPFLPDYAVWILQIGGPIVFVFVLFFCVRWCCRCCLCCQRNKRKTAAEGYDNGYEAAATDRL